MPLRCLIVEDEPAQQKHIKGYIEEMKNELEYIEAFVNVKTAFDYIQNNEIDLIFLDLELSGNLSGIDFLADIKAMNKKPHIIVTSSIYHLIGRAADFDDVVSSYLNKPINFFNFQSRINDLLERIKINVQQNENNDNFSFWEQTTSNDGIIMTRIVHNQIKYISVKGNLSTFHMENNDKINVWKSLNDIEKIIPNQYICRISRDLILGNRRWVINYKHGDNVLKIEGITNTFDVGPVYLVDFKKYMNGLERTKKTTPTG